MISVTELRNGKVFVYYDEPYKVLGYEHIKMSRNGAVIKVKVKHLLSGSIKEISFPNGAKVEEAAVENKNLQYLYKTDEVYAFMDMSDFSQIEIPAENAEYEGKFLIEGREYQVMFYNEKPISIILNPSMFYIVTYSPPAVKGNTATNAYKTVTLENGMELSVPLFIKEGDTVKVNTETGLYVNRA